MLLLIYILCCCLFKYAQTSRESNLLILVNRVVLQTTEKPLVKHKKYPEKFAVYYYGYNDMVDASCISTNNKCTVQLNYDYAEKLHKIFTNKNVSSRTGIGFRAKLDTRHDKSVMICRKKCYENISIVKVKFILKTVLDDVVNKNLNLVINGSTARGIASQLQNYDTKVIEYGYFNEEILNIVASVANDEVRLRWDCNDYNKSKLHYNLNHFNKLINITITPKITIYLNYYLVNKERFDDVVDIFQLRFVPLPSSLLDDKILTFNLPEEHILMELYEYNGRKIIYYEFEEDDPLTLNCSKSSQFKNMVLFMNINDEVVHDERNIIKEAQTSFRREFVVECFMKRINSGKVYRKIEVYFGKHRNIYPVIISVLICLAAIVFLSVSCIYWHKRKKLNRENLVDEMELVSENMTPIPTIASQVERSSAGLIYDYVIATNYENTRPLYNYTYTDDYGTPKYTKDTLYDYVVSY